VDVPGVIATMEGAIGGGETRVAHVLVKAFEHYNAHAYFSLPHQAKISKVLGALEGKSNELGFRKVRIMFMNLACIIHELKSRQGIEEETDGALLAEDTTSPYESIFIPGESGGKYNPCIYIIPLPIPISHICS